jgi:hypothetical protein
MELKRYVTFVFKGVASFCVWQHVRSYPGSPLIWLKRWCSWFLFGMPLCSLRIISNLAQAVALLILFCIPFCSLSIIGYLAQSVTLLILFCIPFCPLRVISDLAQAVVLLISFCMPFCSLRVISDLAQAVVLLISFCLPFCSWTLHVLSQFSVNSERITAGFFIFRTLKDAVMFETISSIWSYI